MQETEPLANVWVCAGWLIALQIYKLVSDGETEMKIYKILQGFYIKQHNNNHHFYGHYTGQLAPPLKNWRILLVQFYCSHALADGNQHIQIREKTLEFSTATVTMPYCLHTVPYIAFMSKRLIQ